MEDGRKCAVGCLIPDQLYDPAWEGKRVEELPISRLFGDVSLRVLKAMQFVHDKMNTDLWEGEFARIAEDYGLTLPKVTR